jgi:hypothetical protein
MPVNAVINRQLHHAKGHDRKPKPPLAASPGDGRMEAAQRLRAMANEYQQKASEAEPKQKDK